MGQQAEQLGAVEEVCTCERQLLLPLRVLHHAHHWQAILTGKLMIPRIVCWHSHDGSAAVATQHIVCHPDWHTLLGSRVDRKAACMAAPEGHLSK